MILNIFNDMWNGITKFVEQCQRFVMDHHDNYFFWIILVAIILLICYRAISYFGDK